MKHFLLPVLPDAGGCVRLRGKDYHYLVRVRRLRVGDSFRALLPVQSSGQAVAGTGEVLVQVRQVDGETLVGRCLPVNTGQGTEPLPPILLFQALPKGAKMDLIVRQATELGIAGIVPFAAERSIPKIQDREGEKSGRWERIVREARQQSGSGVPTFLHEPLDMDGLLAYWDELKASRLRPLGLLFHQDPVNFPLEPQPNPKGEGSPLDNGGLHDYLSEVPDMVALAIGPEGGFSSNEVSRFLDAGFKPVKIGDTVLRTETAALCGAAAVRIILLENASWINKLP
jgi:16S rRNA (uracil1498-N3)-methyltransferase